jgi:hypothetical protein
MMVQIEFSWGLCVKSPSEPGLSGTTTVGMMGWVLPRWYVARNSTRQHGPVETRLRTHC